MLNWLQDAVQPAGTVFSILFQESLPFILIAEERYRVLYSALSLCCCPKLGRSQMQEAQRCAKTCDSDCC